MSRFVHQETASSRIPVTPGTHERLKEFRNGLGGSFDDAIILLLRLAEQAIGEKDDYRAGKKFRDMEKVEG